MCAKPACRRIATLNDGAIVKVCVACFAKFTFQQIHFERKVHSVDTITY